MLQFNDREITGSPYNLVSIELHTIDESVSLDLSSMIEASTIEESRALDRTQPYKRQTQKPN